LSRGALVGTIYNRKCFGARFIKAGKARHGVIVALPATGLAQALGLGIWVKLTRRTTGFPAVSFSSVKPAAGRDIVVALFSQHSALVS
jgi:hypothetical protein